MLTLGMIVGGTIVFSVLIFVIWFLWSERKYYPKSKKEND